MKAILRQEFWSYIKSFKSISILFFFYLTTIISSYFFSDNQNILEGHGAEVDMASSIKFFVFVLGPTLISTVFYDIFNKETESRTMRLLITKTSLRQIFIGKVATLLLFWWVTLTISFLLVFIYSAKFYWIDFISAFSYTSLSGSIVVLLSIVFDHGNKSLLAGILIGISFPVIGLLSSVLDNWFWSATNLVIPYYSADITMDALLAPLLFTILIFCLSYLILIRKDF